MYDVVIIGAGPAGLTASIYASCFHLSHVVIGKIIGGQILLAPDILNYPGFMEITGKELAEKMASQSRARGGTIIEDMATKIMIRESNFEVMTEKGQSFQTRSIILATGTERKRLNVPGELEYVGRGVHYCATCERQDYAGKVVAVAGGANSAAQSAVQLAQAASRVIILYRGGQLRCDPIWSDQIREHPNIGVYALTNISEILGDGQKVTGAKVIKEGKEENILLDKIFIEIGGVPGTALVVPLGVVLDPGGFIHVNDKLATNVPGVFAAGDLISYGLSIEQISSAVGLGARAASSAFSYTKASKSPSAWGSTLIKR